MEATATMELPTVFTPTADHCRAAIARWLELMQRRSECEVASGLRGEDRYFRSWPLVISMPQEPDNARFAVALNNASGKGVGFLSHRPIEVGSAIWVHLYWCDDVPPVPAQVRHVTPTEHGYLIGCAFVLENKHMLSQAAENYRGY